MFQRSAMLLAATIVLLTMTARDTCAFAPPSFVKQSPSRSVVKSRYRSSGQLNLLFHQPAACKPSGDVILDHRHSASDWLYNIKSFPQSKVLREIRNPVLAVAGWSFAVSLVYRLFQTSGSAVLNAAASHMSIPGTAHSFLVSALGLLLVFRTNSAYQRFNVSEDIRLSPMPLLSSADVRLSQLNQKYIPFIS